MERDGEGKVVQLRKLRKGNEKTSAQLRFARITSQGKVGALFQKLFNGFCALVNYFPASGDNNYRNIGLAEQHQKVLIHK